MPNKGPLSQVSFNSVDVGAPGPVVLGTPEQLDNHTVSLLVTPPNVDNDGGVLTGLSKIYVGIALALEDGTSPFVDTDSFFAVATETIVLEGDAVTAPVDVALNIIALNRAHYIAAFAEDGDGQPINQSPVEG